MLCFPLHFHTSTYLSADYLCNTHFKPHIGTLDPTIYHDRYCLDYIEDLQPLCHHANFGTVDRQTSHKLLHIVLTPFFSDGALLAGVCGGTTRNRLADSLNEGLRSQQTGSSSLCNTVVNTFCIIQSGRCRWWQRTGSSSSPFTQSITKTPHFGHYLCDVAITLGIKYFLECTCSSLPHTTTA